LFENCAGVQFAGYDRISTVSPPTRLPNIRILIVDDSYDAAEPLALVLESYGAQAHVAHSVDEALAGLHQWSPDIVISDIAMPQRDGYNFIAALRSSESVASRVPVIACTAYEGEEHRARALRAGFHLLLVKPVDIAVLTYAITLLVGTPRECEPNPQ